MGFAETLLLIDNGFSCKETEARMLQHNINPEDLTAVLVTHEHADHFSGVPRFVNKYKLPAWMSYGTSLSPKASTIQQLNLFSGHENFSLGEIDILPIAVPHDSREAYQFIFQANDLKVGLLTDLGCITPFIREQYANCHLLMLEFNYEHQKLMGGSYPASLKARVSGNFGHLSNDQAKEFLTFEMTQQLRYLIAMHLSEENNSHDLVMQSIESSQINKQTKVFIAEPAGITKRISIT